MSDLAVSAVAVRPETAADEAFLRDLYASTRDEELAVVGWTEQQRRAFCDSQFTLQRAALGTEFPDADSGIVLVDRQPAGRLLIDRTGDAIQVVDIALLPEHRGRGVGTSLLQVVLDEAMRENRSVSLHVLLTNRARRLYERLGFIAVGDAGLSVVMRWGEA